MIAVSDADAVLGRFWGELRTDPRLRDLTAMVPSDRALTVLDALPLLPVIMARMKTPADQLELIDALAHAYARAARLRLMED